MGLIYTAHCHYPWADRVDVTAQSEDLVGVVFAPSWDLRFASLDWRERTEAQRRARRSFLLRYQEEVQQTRARCPAAWRELLTRPVVTLVCYCTRALRCHRVLLAEGLADHGALYQGERPLPYDCPPESERFVERGPMRAAAGARRDDEGEMARAQEKEDAE